jgi:hypothetical protein
LSCHSVRLVERKRLIIGVVLVPILAIACLCVGVLVYAFGGFRPNDAKAAFEPIGHAIESAGGHQLCASGDPGYGPDNTTPWYDVVYQISSDSSLRDRLVAIGGDNGFSLTRRETPDDPTGVRFLQARSNNQRTLTMWFSSRASELKCGSSKVAPTNGTEFVDVQFEFPSRTDGSTTSLAPEATQTPGTPQLPWAQTQFSTFAPFRVDGTGDSAITLPPEVVSGALTVSHDGSGPFAIVALDDSGAPTGERIVDAVGDYAGVVPYGLHGVGAVAKSLTVTSDGSWSISFAPISSIPTITLPSTGSGDKVFRYDGRAGDWMITNTGPDGKTFEVRQYYGDIAFDSAYSGEVACSGRGPVNAGPSIIVVTSSGDWTASRAP